jgi:GNAT superfamily N-acetyltransferase
MSVEENERRWRIRIADRDWETVVAVDDDGALAGFVHFGHNDSMHAATGEIEFLYVATPHQGTGLGTQLIVIGEGGLRTMGFVTAVLWVYDGNMLARDFYERRGWAPDGTRRESGSAPGYWLLRYAKTISG